MNIVQEVVNILKTNQIDYSSINLNNNLDVIINDVENTLVENKKIQNNLLIISKLLKLKRKTEIENLINNNNFQILENEMKKNFKYNIINDEIVIDKIIEIESISYISYLNIYQNCILSKKQKQLIKQENYQITKIYIPLFESLKLIRCDGKHPNLNSKTSEYCLNESFINQPFSYDLINDIFISMTHMSLENSYATSDELMVILNILNN